MIERTTNHRAWFMVLPVLVLVAFNAIIPLMTVVNYSVQETFGNNVFFWEGVKWFQEVIRSVRFHASLLRQMLFTLIILLIEVPLGVVIALSMPKRGFGVTVCLVFMALPLLIPWNVVGAMWNIFAKIFHIAPTTFQGIRSGSAIKTRQTVTPKPRLGILKAITTPKGTSISKMIKVNSI